MTAFADVSREPINIADYKLDDIDHRIIQALQTGGRITNQEVADKIVLSASPRARRVRHLEEACVIGGYVAIINRDKLGLRSRSHAPTSEAFDCTGK